MVFGISTIPLSIEEGLFPFILGIIFVIWAFLRLSTGFGLLRMRRRAWKSAMVIFILGLLIDFVIAQEQMLLDIIIIVYLILVKSEFTY